MAEEKNAGRGEGELEESWRDLCSAILYGHPNLFQNLFPSLQPGRTPTKVVESLL